MLQRIRRFRWFLVVLLICGALPGGGYLALQRTLPQLEGALTVPGLQAPITIKRDPDSVPHIFAQSRNDALFGLGYVHAQDRLWQMEFQRRAGSGRLAEVLGESAVESDRFFRTLGLQRTAIAAWEDYPPATQAAITAYVAGINAVIGEHRWLPLEFTLLGTTPTPWIGADVILWQKTMAWNLGDNWQRELLRAQISRVVGAERAAEVLPSTPEHSLAAADLDRFAPLLDLSARTKLPLINSADLGSNSWSIAGSKSVTGKPLLANDPHLGTQMPVHWYVAHLSAPDYEVIGATLPGIPGVIIGHNRSIAWGITNAQGDVQDLFRERLDHTGTQVEFAGQMEPLQLVTETITVKDSITVEQVVRISRHGPLISDLLPNTPPDEGLALRWTALDPGDQTITTFIELGAAANWDAFKAALQPFVAPAQNFVYADTAGHIGLYTAGRFPVRASGDGLIPAIGTTDVQAWQGSVPFAELPQIFDPREQQIVSANNRPITANAPYIGQEFALPFRYQRIATQLEATPQFSIDTLAALQLDVYSGYAQTLLPQLLALVESAGASTNARRTDALQLLRQWDGQADGDSGGAALFAAWYQRLPRALAGDELGDQIIVRYEEDINATVPFVERVLATPDSFWCDNRSTPDAESCSLTVTTALDEAIEDLTVRLGSDQQAWRWDALHRVVMSHQALGQDPVLGRWFGRSAMHGGDSSTVNVGPSSANYEQRVAAGYRQLIDLSDFDNSRFILSGGQSGHVVSPAYDDMLDDWQRGHYRPLRFTPATIDAATSATLRLQPSQP